MKHTILQFRNFSGLQLLKSIANWKTLEFVPITAKEENNTLSYASANGF